MIKICLNDDDRVAELLVITLSYSTTRYLENVRMLLKTHISLMKSLKYKLVIEDQCNRFVSALHFLKNSNRNSFFCVNLAHTTILNFQSEKFAHGYNWRQIHKSDIQIQMENYLKVFPTNTARFALGLLKGRYKKNVCSKRTRILRNRTP